MNNEEISASIENVEGKTWARVLLPAPELGREREFVTDVNLETFEILGTTLVDDGGGMWVDSELMEDYPEIGPHISRIEAFVKGMKAMAAAQP